MSETPDFWEWLAGQNLPRSSAEADLAHAAWVAAVEYTNIHGSRVEGLLAANEELEAQAQRWVKSATEAKDAERALRAQLDAIVTVVTLAGGYTNDGRYIEFEAIPAEIDKILAVRGESLKNP